MGVTRKGIKSDGRSKTRLYIIYLNMKSRCYYINNPRYKDYGLRGINICKEWKSDFLEFKNWANANRYSDNLTIDRIDVNGNYEPSNCRWTTNKEQQNNRTNNFRIEYEGVTKTLQEWSESLDINSKTLQKRIKKWGIKKAFTTPLSLEHRRRRHDKSVS